jgi:hypothetical protein
MEDRTFDRISRAMAGTSSRRQALKLLGGGIAGGTLAAVGITAAKDAAAQTGPGVLSFPVDFANALGAFAGTFDVTQFAVQQGQVVAIGTLVGTVTDAVGNVIGSVSQALTLPVISDLSGGDCDILHLVLGPLDLDLLGLVVHLDTIVLDITAEQGGGLLGDLLCAIAGLLDGNGGALGRLRNLLNQLLGALGGA